MVNERNLEDGEQQIIRRGQRPASGWHNRTVIQMEEEGEQWLISALPRKRPSGGSGGGTAPEPPPTPDPPPAPEEEGVQGYCRVWMLANGKSGGSLDVDHIHTPHPSATIYTVSTFAALKSALLASGRRFIRVVGSAVLDGANATVKIDNPSCTVDFSAHTGEVRNFHLFQITSDDHIWTQGALRTGEGSSAAASKDRRDLTLNPGNEPGDELHGVCLDHMSMGVGPDVVGSILYKVCDTTIQYCLIGPGLLLSNNVAENPNGYGWNITIPNAHPELRATHHALRITFYRNLSALCKQRNMKTEHVEGYDGVNNVIYDFNQAPIYGNPTAANYVNNIFKKGPESKPDSNRDAFEEDGGSGSLAYPQYPNSTYHSGNIGLKADGSSYTLNWSRISASALRATAYDGGPTDADHGPLVVATADMSLFNDVVDNAGRTFEDALDALIKGYVRDGDSAGYYVGAAYSGPHYP